MKRILALILAAVLLLSLSACGKNIWEELILGYQLPEPPSVKGEIHFNDAENLHVDLSGISDQDYANYVAACKDAGYTIDAEENGTTYRAYNSEGYLLYLNRYTSNDELSIQLDIPMELGTIQWPAGAAGQLIPAPKSTVGKFSYEHDDSFFLYVGDMEKSDYDAYVAACSDAGFNVDYNKGDDYYYADNSAGDHIDLRYEGFSIISISVSCAEEPSETPEVPEETPAEPAPEETDESSAHLGISPDFQAAMDSYEAFIDEYIAFMEKYNENSNDLSLLADYADYMSKYADFVKDFEQWEDAEMNAAETAYYLDVQARVSKKLLTAAS